jgi:hypothetical protein
LAVLELSEKAGNFRNTIQNIGYSSNILLLNHTRISLSILILIPRIENPNIVAVLMGLCFIWTTEPRKGVVNRPMLSDWQCRELKSQSNAILCQTEKNV